MQRQCCDDTNPGTGLSRGASRTGAYPFRGIDRPLVISKNGQSVIPHQNWRGQFARGTYPDGTRSDCPPGVTTGCTPIQWPGERTTARHELEPSGEIRNWFGGLVDGMRDASGQMYMRNRYYDPQTGQFTQADPIGLAGGLNAFGFAAGDPVSFSDPYGLCILPRAICEAFARAGDEAVSYWAGRAASADSRAERYVATGIGLLAALCTTDTCEHTDRTLRGDLVGGARGALQGIRGGVVGHAADEPSSPNQMNQEVRSGAAPSTIERVDRAHGAGAGPDSEPHIHFTNMRATLGQSGTWGHLPKGQSEPPRQLTNQERAWVQKHNWPTGN